MTIYTDVSSEASAIASVNLWNTQNRKYYYRIGGFKGLFAKKYQNTIIKKGIVLISD
jgi:hypothetical protein